MRCAVVLTKNGRALAGLEFDAISQSDSNSCELALARLYEEHPEVSPLDGDVRISFLPIRGSSYLKVMRIETGEEPAEGNVDDDRTKPLRP